MRYRRRRGGEEMKLNLAKATMPAAGTTKGS